MSNQLELFDLEVKIREIENCKMYPNPFKILNKKGLTYDELTLSQYAACGQLQQYYKNQRRKIHKIKNSANKKNKRYK